MKQAIPKNFLVIILPICVCLWAGQLLGAGTGLLGDYFNNVDFTSLKLTRTDATINFDWGTNAPDSSMGADTFSVRWSGQVEPRFSETYIFYLSADDGARLWVNDRLLVARTFPSSNVLEVTGSIALKAGQRYTLQLEYTQNSGTGFVKLKWSSASQGKEIVSQTQLYPVIAGSEAGAVLQETWMGLPGTDMGTLASNTNFPNRPDGREFLTSFESLVPNWADNYGRRVSGYIVPAVSGNYLFAVSGDETVQLYLSNDDASSNKQLIAWTTAPTGFRNFSNSASQISAPINLTASQKYYVELLHKESTGDDHFSVGWQRPGSPSFEIIPGANLVQPGLERPPPSRSKYFDTLTLSHPRLFATEERFEWLRRAVASNAVPQLADWWGKISNSANAILSQPTNAYTQDARGTIMDVSKSVLDRVQKLSLAWRMTGNSAFSERAWQELEAAASFPNWNDTNHFLDTAEMTHAFALGYDWLYDYWTPTRRDTIRTAIIDKGLTPSLRFYSNFTSWASSTENNWNLVCNGGMMLGALAVGTESESLAEYVAWRAVASAGPVMQHWTADNGGWYEGPHYWGYTTDYNIRLLAGLESALGSDFKLSATAGLWNSGLFPIYMVGPTKLSFNFADAATENLCGPTLFWMARRFNRPEYAYYERTNALANKLPEALDLLWHDLRGTDFQSSGLSLGNYFRGPTGVSPYPPAEAVSLRSRWEDPDAMFVGFRAGVIDASASHGHLDAGSFVFDALGKRWAHDLGPEDYDLPEYFKDAHWSYYRVRAEGHNTLVINPASGVDQNLNSHPAIVLFSNGEEGGKSVVVSDVTPAYNVTRVWRGLALDPTARSLLIQDEIEAAAPATVWWFMHIQTNELVRIDGTSVMLTTGTDRLWMKIITGDGVFTLRNATPLPGSPNPAGQSANANYGKLAIQLSAVTNTTLAVLMVPLRAGENPPSQLPEITALQDWGRTTANTAPVASRTNLVVGTGGVDLDLRDVVFDGETSSSQLAFAVGAASNGTASLLADGHTLRYTPGSNYSEPVNVSFTILDQYPDARLLLYYSYEPPVAQNASAVTDDSGHYREGTLDAVGTGSFGYEALASAALGLHSVQSLRLTSSSTNNGARLSRNLSKEDFDMSDNDWTFATWFRRESTNTDDYIFFMGYGDGYGGSGDEFYVYCPKRQRSLALAHWTGGIQDVSVSSGTLVNTIEWHHAAVVFNRTNFNAGVLRLYLDGALVGSPTNVSWALTQSFPLRFGGHAISTNNVERWFDGYLDETVLLQGALSASEIARLTNLPAAYLGGITVTGMVIFSPLKVQIERTPTDLTFRWPLAAGTFDLYWATNLTPPVVWNLRTNQVEISGTNFELHLAVPADRMRFYRLQSH